MTIFDALWYFVLVIWATFGASLVCTLLILKWRLQQIFSEVLEFVLHFFFVFQDTSNAQNDTWLEFSAPHSPITLSEKADKVQNGHLSLSGDTGASGVVVIATGSNNGCHDWARVEDLENGAKKKVPWVYFVHFACQILYIFVFVLFWIIRILGVHFYLTEKWELWMYNLLSFKENKITQ